MKQLLLPFVAIVVLAAALAGCGQKGALYQPDDEKAKSEHSKDRYGL